MSRFKFHICRFLFGAIIAVILVMTLISRESVNGVYLYIAQLLSVDLVWVKSNAVHISNVGHVSACFLLSCFALLIFKISYFRIIICVAGFAAFGEILQIFLATRQATIEDIIFSLCGITIAIILDFLIKRRLFFVRPVN